jgi:hypothetical protein
MSQTETKQKRDVTSLSIPNEFLDEIKPLAELLGWSANQFGTEAIKAVIQLSKCPRGGRSVPRMVRMLDAISEDVPLPEQPLQLNELPPVKLKPTPEEEVAPIPGRALRRMKEMQK